MESYTTNNGHCLTLGMFVESATLSEAGRLVAIEERLSRKDRDPVAYGLVAFETGRIAGGEEWAQCEGLYPVPTPQEVIARRQPFQDNYRFLACHRERIRGGAG